MRIKKETRGTGITRRPVYQFNNDAGTDTAPRDELVGVLAEAISGNFPDRLMAYATRLNGGTRPPEGVPSISADLPDDEAWYARQITAKVEDLDQLLQMVADELGITTTALYNRLDGVFWHIYALGRLTKEAEMKFRHEPDAVRGENLVKHGRIGGEKRKGRITGKTQLIRELHDQGLSNSEIVKKLRSVDPAKPGAVKQAVRRYRKTKNYK